MAMSSIPDQLCRQRGNDGADAAAREKRAEPRLSITGAYGVMDEALGPTKGVFDDNVQGVKAATTEGSNFGNGLLTWPVKDGVADVGQKYCTMSPPGVTILVAEPGSVATNVGAWKSFQARPARPGDRVGTAANPRRAPPATGARGRTSGSATPEEAAASTASTSTGVSPRSWSA